MQMTWPSARLWRRIAIAVAALLLIAILALRLFAMSPVAADIVSRQLNAQSVRGQTIEVSGLRGDLLGRMSASQLTVRDADGVWLDARDVELAWSPLALVSNYLKLHDVSAASLDIARQPTLAPSTSSGGAVFDRYSLDRFVIGDWTLAEGVAGPEQSYAVTARFQAKGMTGEVLGRLVPVTSPGDRADIELSWGGAVPLEGNVQIEGEPSGLIATLLQAPEGEAISASLDASGGFLSWTISGSAMSGDAEVLNLDVAQDRNELRTEGWVALDAFGVLSPLQKRLGNRAEFETRRARDGSLVATMEADTLSAEVSGKFVRNRTERRLEDMVLTMTDANAPALTGARNLTLPQLRASGVLTEMDGAYSFEGELSAPTFEYGRYGAQALQGDGRLTYETGSLGIDMSFAADRLNGLPQSVAQLAPGRATALVDAAIPFAARQIVFEQFDLTTNRLRADATGTLGFGGAIDLQGRATLDDYARLDSVSGNWALSGPGLSQLVLDFEGDVSPGDQIPALAGLIGERAAVTLKARREGKTLRLDAASLRSEMIDLSAVGQSAGGELRLDGTLASERISVAGAEAKAVGAEIALSGPLASLRGGLNATLGSLTFSGQEFEDVSLSADLSRLTGPDFLVAADARFAGAPLALSVSGQYAADAIRADTITLNWDELNAQGQGAIDLADLAQSELVLEVDGRAPLVGELSGSVAYRDLLLDAELAIADTVYGPIDVKTARLDMQGTWPQFEGDLAYEAEVPVLGEDLPASGALDLGLDAIARTLSVGGSGRLAEQEFAISSPIRVDFGSGLSIDGVLSALGGRITLDVDPSGLLLTEVRVEDVSMAALGSLIQRPSLRGVLNAQSKLQITDGLLLNGDAQVSIIGLARGLPDAPTADIELQATIVENVLTANLQAGDADRSLDLFVDLESALEHNGSLPSIRQLKGASTPIRIRGGGPIAPLWVLAAPPDLRLEGDFSINADNGTGETFRFRGPLRFQNGVFEDGFTGLHLKAIDVSAELSENGIDVQSARANGSNSGSLSASGSYRFDGIGAVDLDLNQLNAFSRSDLSATVSGAAKIDRQNRRTRIQGDLDLDQARVNLATLPGSGYTTIDVIFLDPTQEAVPESPAREAIMLDLRVRAERRVFVFGRGVDSEWRADVRVSGNAGAPRLIGRANLVRGEADLLSRRFRLSEGVIRFIGAPADTQLLLRADRTADGITSSINLAGDLNDPEITLSASPALPDDEILARVLFGRSPSQLSPLQAAQLAGAAAQLAGGDAFNLTGGLEAATGLDRLDFGFDETGGATLATGKYLADDVYLEVQSGVSGAPGVALEWTPLENLAIDAEVDPELGPKVAIQWKRDFDRLPFEEKDE